MKTKVLLAAVAVAFSFAVTSCGNQKSANADSTAADSCCAAKTEQVCDSAKKACCKADSSTCPKAACDRHTIAVCLFLLYIRVINVCLLIKCYFFKEKSYEFVCMVRNNLYLCSVKYKKIRWFRTLHIFYCVALLFYWQSLVEVGVVHKYMWI